jgi:uncharacterized protein DUF6519
MKGDFTRNPFDPARQYSRVLMQQGRVQLDADWNEQAAIFTHYLRALARDLIGPHGRPAMAGPNGNTNFRITTDIDDVYDASGAKLDPDSDVYETLHALLSENPDGNAPAFVINPGRYYVDGILVENHAPIAYSQQPGFDAGAFGDSPDLPLLVYLDVWERHVTSIEDPRIREVALGGPDTTTRARIVWQVRTHSRSEGGNAPVCDVGEIPPRPGTGRLRARARQGAAVSTPCVIASTSSYRGVENQLYRVEIVRGGEAGDGGATFAWSRENGSVAMPVVSIGAPSTVDGKTRQDIAVATLGRDDRLGLQLNDWVSLEDDIMVMQGRVDALLQVVKIDADSRTVTLQGTTAVRNDGTHKLLRRWDQKLGVDADGTLAVRETPVTDDGLADENWIALEDGLEIWFAAGGRYAPGDYWMIPARVATGDIEWPEERDAQGKPRTLANGFVVPKALPADGPHHYYAPLGVLTTQANGEIAIGSCECEIVPPVTCGDGAVRVNAATKPSKSAVRRPAKRASRRG